MTTTHRRAGVLGVGTATAPATATSIASAPVQRVAVPAGAAHSAPPATSVDPDALPWGQVGPGWSAVAYTTHPSAGPDTDYPQPVGPFTVALVSPTGRRWTVGSSTQLLDLRDVSPDGTHVLAIRFGASSEVVELDTRRHTWRDVAPADNGLSLLRYTTPSAQQIWLGRFDGPTTQHVERVDRGGRVTLQVDGVDQLVPTGDGRLFATPAGRASIALHDNATGAVVRTVADPSGYHDCVVASSWSGSVLEGWCTSDAVAGLTDVLLLDTATGRWSALTHAAADDHQAPMGYDGALPTPAGPLVLGTVGCGSGPVGLLDRDGRVGRWLTWTGAPQSPEILGVAGTTVYAAYTECASPTQVVASQVLGTGRTTLLLRAPWLSAVAVGERL